MNYKIRKILKHEYPLLNAFLYEAIFIPEGIEPPPKTIITSPELQVYIDRGLGIGTALMKEILAQLKEHGYRRVSLSVQKANYAVKLYRKVGFEIVRDNEEEYIMVHYL